MRVDAGEMHKFGGAIDWQGWRHKAALSIGRNDEKRWPLHEKVSCAT